MNFTHSYRSIIATLVTFVYLAMPATEYARAAALVIGSTSGKTFSTMTTAPCDTCPCPDEDGSGCCDTTFCSCEFHAPLGQGVRLTYSPVVAIHNFPEPSWTLKQVYLPIFVPPQSPV